MVAGVLCQSQIAIEIRLHNALGLVLSRTHHDSYALLAEYVLSAFPHSASDDNICTFIVQPARKQARLMRWRVNLARTENLTARNIHLEKAKSFAMTEMGTQLPVGYGDRDNHVFFD